MVFDTVIRNGVIYDGSGGEPRVADVAVSGERIAAIGKVTSPGRVEFDATDLAVAPGFINMMCWANESLIEDGLSQSDIRQGVTLEVMGEGWSMGPLNEELKAYLRARQGDIRYDIEWTTLGEYLDYLVRRGVSPNVASFIGAGGVRANVLGFADRRPTPGELARMQQLVRQALLEGAVGLSSALIYFPDAFADTDELIALAQVVAEYGGLYITHLRSEGRQFIAAVEEFFTIMRESGARGEIYHLKASGKENWPKLDQVIRLIEERRAEGLAVTADMYPYNASSTGLNAIMPGWVQEGGHEAWVKRLRDPAVRQRLIHEMTSPDSDQENVFDEASSADHILLRSFKSERLKPLAGKTLAEVAAARGTSPLETAFDLIAEDDSRVGAIYFTMSEENVRKKMALPWVSFCSDSESLAPQGVFLKSSPHPRAYGSFARVLGKYVRDEGIIPLQEAVRRLSALPAANLRLTHRGRLAEGYFADIVVFDPLTVRDRATFTDPHQYATGVAHVWVNGAQVLQDGEHTGAKPGQVVRGPGAGNHLRPDDKSSF